MRLYYYFFHLLLRRSNVVVATGPAGCDGRFWAGAGEIIANYSRAIKRKLHEQHVPWSLQYCEDPPAAFRQKQSPQEADKYKVVADGLLRFNTSHFKYFKLILDFQIK